MSPIPALISTAPSGAKGARVAGRTLLSLLAVAVSAATAVAGQRNMGPVRRFVPETGTKVNVANPDLLDRLTPAERAVLAEHGMVGQMTGIQQMHAVYSEARRQDLPILVTTDGFLHVFQAIYGFALRDAESRYFYDAVQRMLELLVVHQGREYERAERGPVRDALLANIAFLSVPLAILDSTFPVPPAVEELVRDELRVIDAHAGFRESPVLGYSEDYSQYRPRGHYTLSERLSRYFKAQMFISRMTFRLDPEEPVRARQAVLLACGFDATWMDSAGTTPAQHWSRVYEPTAWLAGEADDLLPRDISSFYAVIAGNADPVEWLASDDNVNRLLVVAQTLPAPKILSDLLFYTERLSRTRGMRLMGQRYVLDAHVIGNLVAPHVGRLEPDLTRLPTGLDVMAALGSDRAREHLVNTFRQDTVAGYLAALDSIRQVFDAFTPDDWNGSIYYGWLNVLRLNLMPVSEPRKRTRMAKFTSSPVYTDKALVASLGSWAELRHNTLLYVKMTYDQFTGLPLGRPPKHQAYVEPRPEVFDALAQLADRFRVLLESAGIGSERVIANLDRYAEVTRRFADIGRTHLDGKDITEQDVEFCRRTGHELKSLVALHTPGAAVDPEQMPVVADVFTDTNRGSVLQVAVGNPVRLYAVIPFYGDEYLAVGAGFSYYEFTRPMDERMTNEEWRALRERPHMPVWTQSFIPAQP